MDIWERSHWEDWTSKRAAGAIPRLTNLDINSDSLTCKEQVSVFHPNLQLRQRPKVPHFRPILSPRGRYSFP